MTETLGYLAAGFAGALTLENIAFCAIGAILGTLTGVLPGLGPVSAIAILLPLTAVIPATGAIIMLAGIYYGSQYGGSTTSILLRIPGEVSSVATTLDGYPAARKGLAGPALVIAALGSFVAGTIGLLLLTFLAPVMAEVALAFGPPEYVALMLLALTAIAGLSGSSLTRGLISAVLGLLIGAVGPDPSTGIPRLTFGNTSLIGGLNFVAASIGLFAITEVLLTFSDPERRKIRAEPIKRFLPTRQELRSVYGSMLRGSAVGSVLGLMPGIGPGIVSFLSYDLERRVSRHPERFGHGALEGVAGPESANNAATSSGFVPLLAFGIPPTAALAVLLGAFLIYGLSPGPLLFAEEPELIWAVIASMYVGNVLLLVLNIPLVRVWTLVLRVPPGVLLPVVVVLSTIGALTARGNYLDVFVMAGFGFLGYVMTRLSFPIAPLVLTLLLGPRLEADFRRVLILSGGSIDYLMDRPIAVVVLGVTGGLIVISAVRSGIRRGRQASALL